MPGRNTSPFKLVEDSVSRDTVEALEELLAHARKGQIVGLAFVAMLRRREFICNTAGECRRSPAATRGFVLSLLDKLGQQVGSRF